MILGLVLSLIVGSFGAQAQSVKEVAKSVGALDGEAAKLREARSEIDRRLNEIEAKKSQLLSVDAAIALINSSKIPQGCTLSRKGEQLHLRNEVGETEVFQYVRDAQISLQGDEGGALQLWIDLGNTMDNQLVSAQFNSTGELTVFYAEKSERLESSVNFKARCLK